MALHGNANWDLVFTVYPDRIQFGNCFLGSEFGLDFLLYWDLHNVNAEAATQKYGSEKEKRGIEMLKDWA